MKHALTARQGLFGVLFFLSITPALSASSPEALPRRILALYSRKDYSENADTVFFSQAHRRAEMPLNHLGMELVFHDVAEPLPKAEDLAGYRGVLAWFESPYAVSRPQSYCAWLDSVLDRGLKLVILGDPGVLNPTRNGDIRVAPECSRLFDRLGYEFDSVAQPSPLDIDIVEKETDMVELERKLWLREIEKFIVVRAPASKSYLKLALRYAGEPSHQVVVNEFGGMALDPFLLYRKREYQGEKIVSEFLRWRLNPFAFFEEAFALKGWPRPDVTTVNGRRLYYSQVDGDGYFNVSEWDRESWSGDVFRSEIVEKNLDSPFTLSLITGYYDLQRYKTDEARESARKTLRLPNVEPASHGYAHPLIWRKSTVAVGVPGYQFDPRREILGSTEFINNSILGAGRKSSLFLWTGDAVPLEKHLAVTEEAGMLNLNGGDSRFDGWERSYAFVAPIGRLEGRYRQIYASCSNENVYTNLWTGPFYSYRDVLETFRNMESPRRVKPVDVYVHFYSAEKLAALKALKDVYAWARSQPLHPVTTGSYARIARSFYDMRLSRLEEGRYLLEGAPLLRTVRFDSEERDPDLSRSLGVIGYNRHQGSLYVHLDEKAPREVVFSSSAVTLPHVAEANFEITRFERREDSLRFQKRGWWSSQMVLAGLEPGRGYRMRSGASSKTADADASGRLALSFPGEGGAASTEVSVEPLP